MVGHILGVYQYCEPSIDAVAQGATVYSEVIDARQFVGFNSVELTTTAGQITVSFEGSMTPEVSDFGTIYGPDGVELGAVVADLSAGTRKIQPDAIMFPYIRLKIVEAGLAPTTVTAKLLARRKR